MAAAENPSRETILQRIRDALKSPSAEPDQPNGGPVFPPVTDTLDRFKTECAANMVECIVTSSPEESAEAIRATLASLPDGDVFIQDATDLRRMLGQSTTPQARRQGKILWSNEGPAPEAAQGSVTLAELLVAATGTIMVSSSCGGRRGSIVPPCHIVYATTSQIVPDLEAAVTRMSENGVAIRNSFVGLITGSSRTADIEKILVLGAHGPRRVVVVLENTDERH